MMTFAFLGFVVVLMGLALAVCTGWLVVSAGQDVVNLGRRVIKLMPKINPLQIGLARLWIALSAGWVVHAVWWYLDHCQAFPNDWRAYTTHRPPYSSFDAFIHAQSFSCVTGTERITHFEWLASDFWHYVLTPPIALLLTMVAAYWVIKGFRPARKAVEPSPPELPLISAEPAKGQRARRKARTA